MTWRGALLGFTPAAEAVSGDASIHVDVDALTGNAAFMSLERWMAGQPPGLEGTGTTWGDGDLRYDIAVRGNTFRETGGDDGRLTGIFTGASHGRRRRDAGAIRPDGGVRSVARVDCRDRPRAATPFPAGAAPRRRLGTHRRGASISRPAAGTVRALNLQHRKGQLCRRSKSSIVETFRGILPSGKYPSFFFVTSRSNRHPAMAGT